jgi:hypothetical protein
MMRISIDRMSVVSSAASVFMLLTVLASACENRASSSVVDVEVVSHIDISDLWHARNPIVLRDPSGLVVGVWPSDLESAALKDGKVLAAFAIAGVGDVAETPVAVRIWSTAGLEFLSDETKEREGKDGAVILLFHRAGCGAMANCSDEVVSVAVQLNPETLQVTVNGEAVGTIVTP